MHIWTVLSFSVSIVSLSVCSIVHAIQIDKLKTRISNLEKELYVINIDK